MTEKPNAPEELFPGVKWSTVAGGMFVRGTVGGFTCELWIPKNGRWYSVFEDRGCGHDSQSEALDWLRARIIQHRDELCRVTGTVARPVSEELG